MSLDPSTISVVVSGLVAVATLLVVPLLNYLIDSRKWARERRVQTLESMTKSTVELLDVLSLFSSLAFERAYDSDEYKAFRSKYYAWELTIWPHCQPADRERLRHLRQRFETVEYKQLHAEGPSLASEVFALAHSAQEKFR